MSTRANVRFVVRGKQLYTVPIPCDGYPSGVGPDLVKALKKTKCRSVRNTRAFLRYASMFVIEEQFTDYTYEVDVSGDEYKIAVLYGSGKKPKFSGTLDEFAAWMEKG